MSIGVYLKYSRIRQKITQEDLGIGICSPSYLSRIENDKIKADDEIYHLLFKRLGLSYENIIKEDSDLDIRLEEWYKSMIVHGKSYEDVDELKELCTNSSSSNDIKFQIIYCRYLLHNNQIERARTKLSDLKQITTINKNTRKYFMYINVLMIYYYLQKKYRKALNIALQTSKLDHFYTLGNDYEIGSFYYNIGLNYKNLYRYDKCKHYTEKALNVFLESYYLEWVVYCHILLGISFNNLGESNSAIKIYSRAKRLLEYLPDDFHRTHLGMIDHNIGYCYQNIGEYGKAIDYYSKCIKYETNKGNITTMINLVHCYYSLGNMHKAKDTLLSTIELKNKTTLKIHKLDLKILELIILEDDLSSEQIIELLDNFFILVEQKLWSVVIYYGEIIANLLEEKHRYKKANEIYKTIIKAKNQLLDRAGVNL